jgi:hypothetical protein
LPLVFPFFEKEKHKTPPKKKNDGKGELNNEELKKEKKQKKLKNIKS